jgi:hypothetical protein
MDMLGWYFDSTSFPYQLPWRFFSFNFFEKMVVQGHARRVGAHQENAGPCDAHTRVFQGIRKCK